jgi:hypothetical protein
MIRGYFCFAAGLEPKLCDRRPSFNIFLSSAIDGHWGQQLWIEEGKGQMAGMLAKMDGKEK